MDKRLVRFLTLVIILAPVAAAQKWEFGGGAGGGFYTSQDVKSAALSGSVKIASGLAASAWLDNNNGKLWGGELRYDFQSGDLQVSSQSAKAAFGAQTHGIHYDFVLHATPREAKIRPFVAFGGGVKVYSGTGTEVRSQPLNQLALLTKTSETRGMLSLGAGVKINTGRFGFRIEAHDFMTQFPNKVIAGAQNVSIGGWLHDLVVSAGISLLF
jgi:Outer membrane protein beta-barrel domain